MNIDKSTNLDVPELYNLYLKTEYIDHFNILFEKEIGTKEDVQCCICFSDNNLITNEMNNPASLSDLEKHFFIDDIIPNDLLIKSCCNVHYICTTCIRKIVNNYENHPINELNSHFACPYPFEECVTDIGFKNVFDHNQIKKICISDQEWNNYISHANTFAFPGFTITKCPMYYYHASERYLCDTPILIENEMLKSLPIGDVMVECTQNEFCLKKFCYHCKQYMTYYNSVCYDCKTTFENENPNVYNYYINKHVNNFEIDNLIGTNDTIDTNNLDDSENLIDYDQSSYLYLNKEISKEIVIEQILNIIKDVNTYMICCICKNSLYKTERCNGLSHHNIERCYVCGRIGFPIKGLCDHWNIYGITGCFRFDHDFYVKTYIPEYICNDSVCSNHDMGDCAIPEHQGGIEKLDFVKKRSYIYHILKSLLPQIRYDTYDELYELCNTNNELFQYLPYKQTLILINFYKNRQKDFSEEIVYNELNCKPPFKIYNQEKNKYIPAEEYISNYTNNTSANNTSSAPSSSNDQSYIYSILRPIMSPINENGAVDISIQTNPNDLINITNTIDTTDIIDAINRISISNTIDTINSINAIDTNVTNVTNATIDINVTIDTNDTNVTSQNNMYYTLDSDTNNDTDSTINELPQITIDSYLLLADIEEYINHYNYTDTDSDSET